MGILFKRLEVFVKTVSIDPFALRRLSRMVVLKLAQRFIAEVVSRWQVVSRILICHYGLVTLVVFVVGIDVDTRPVRCYAFLLEFDTADVFLVGSLWVQEVGLLVVGVLKDRFSDLDQILAQMSDCINVGEGFYVFWVDNIEKNVRLLGHEQILVGRLSGLLSLAICCCSLVIDKLAEQCHVNLIFRRRVDTLVV